MNLLLITNMEFDGVDHNDYPDYCDAYCVSAHYDGEQMTEEQLDELNTQYRDFVYERLIYHIF